MAKFNEPHVFTGMQRDIDISRHPASMLHDARNIRLTQRNGEGDTLYAITNEKGTTLTSVTITGTYLGHALLNQYLVIFSKDTSGVVPPGQDTFYPDWITLIDLSSLSVRYLYKGDLGFSLDHPITAIGFYENDNVQKVYWVDGKNQVRMINIAGYIKPEVDTQFDFLPTLALNETISVKKRTGSTGSFPSGVIQYMFTYYRKFGQESNIFYTTPLLYVSPLDRGGAPDEKVSNSFEIKIKDVDTNFDYLRIYSLQRTSLNSTPIARRVRDIEIGSGNSKYTFIDTGVEGESIDPTELLFKQREAVIVDTIDQKDNTLFLGNIQYEHKALPTPSQNDPIRITPSRREITVKENNERDSYVYYNQLNAVETTTAGERNIPCGGFKRGEYYRLGVQFQDKYGKWSDPLFISDEMETEWPSSNVNTVTLPTFKGTIPSSYVKTLVSKGYKKARAVVVFPDIQDREILCQGVTCPTVYRVSDCEDTVQGGIILDSKQAQSSWFFRSVHKSEDYLISPSGAIAPVYEGEIPTSAEIVGDKGINAGDITSLPRQWEIQGYYTPSNRFRIADSTFQLDTFHSPDIEFASDAVSQSFRSTMYKIVGYSKILKTLSDIDIQTSSPTISNMGSGFDHHSLITDGAKGIVAGLFYDDYVVDEIKESTPPYFRDFDKEQSSVKWLVYPWQRSGALNNDINRPANAGTKSAELLKKRISNLRYGATSWIKKSTQGSYIDDNSLDPISFFDSDGEYPALFMEDSNSILKIGNLIYKGNVDTVLMPDLADGYYFCFDDSLTDVAIKDYIIAHPGETLVYGSWWLDIIKSTDFSSSSMSASFTSPVTAFIKTDFTSNSWWKTFAISDAQSSSISTREGTVRVLTDFGIAYIQRKVDESYVTEGNTYTGRVGTVLILTVAPQDGYAVKYWRQGGPDGKVLTSTTGDESIKIQVDYSVKTYYAELKNVGKTSGTTNNAHVYLLTSPNNGGIVTGEGDYAIGSTVQISATPNSGYVFAGWKDSENQLISTERNTSVVVPSTGGLYTAYFEDVSTVVQTYIYYDSRGEINVGEAGGESTTVISGEATNYPMNKIIVLSASPYESNLFRNWIVVDESGTRINADSRYAITIRSASTDIYANFYNPNDTTTAYQTPIFDGTKGSVSVNGQALESGDDVYYSLGETIVLEAEAAEGYEFDYWQLRDDLSGTIIESAFTNPYAVTVFSERCTIFGYFKEVSPSTESTQTWHYSQSRGSVYVNDSFMEPEGTTNYPVGTSLALKANPMGEFDFYGWYIDGVSVQTNPYTFKVSGSSHSITASFVEKAPSVNIYVTSNVVDENGSATIIAGGSGYGISPSYKTATISYTPDTSMQMTATSSDKTISKWQISSDGVNYEDITSTGGYVNLYGIDTDTYYKVIFS